MTSESTLSHEIDEYRSIPAAIIQKRLVQINTRFRPFKRSKQKANIALIRRGIPMRQIPRSLCLRGRKILL